MKKAQLDQKGKGGGKKRIRRNMNMKRLRRLVVKWLRTITARKRKKRHIIYDGREQRQGKRLYSGKRKSCVQRSRTLQRGERWTASQKKKIMYFHKKKEGLAKLSGGRRQDTLRAEREKKKNLPQGKKGLRAPLIVPGGSGERRDIRLLAFRKKALGTAKNGWVWNSGEKKRGRGISIYGGLLIGGRKKSAPFFIAGESAD